MLRENKIMFAYSSDFSKSSELICIVFGLKMRIMWVGAGFGLFVDNNNSPKLGRRL